MLYNLVKYNFLTKFFFEKNIYLFDNIEVLSKSKLMIF